MKNLVVDRELTIYTQGLVATSVCTTIEDREEIEDRVNLATPTGISSRWKLSKDPTFADGKPNPCRCTIDAHRWHYLLSC